jgi:hypothetical protein
MDLSNATLDHLRHVAALPDLAGTRYEVESEIGRGGVGVVYLAHDRQLDRLVALKIVDTALAGEPRLIARLEHPAIIPIYETGTLPDGRIFYAMKLVTGNRLDRHLTPTATLAERLRVIRRAGEAVAFAHARGILHRDLKPQNIMVGSFGEVYVMDWGVDMVAGTPGFRAPEAKLDERSDVYSLGALLKFLLAPPAPRPLAAIVEKAMDQDPERRYADVAGFLADIGRFEDGQAVQAWAEPVWHKVYRVWSQNAVLLWLLVAYVIVKFLLFFLRTR